MMVSSLSAYEKKKPLDHGLFESCPPSSLHACVAGDSVASAHISERTSIQPHSAKTINLGMHGVLDERRLVVK